MNISSVVGRIALPMLGIYSATKYAMEAISDAMRIELRSQGIGVVLVEPGPIVSNFRKNASTIAEERLDTGTSRFGGLYEKEIARRKNQVKKPDFFRKPPEDVAKKVLHALESSKPKLRYCVTIPAYAVSFSRRFIPERLMDRIIGARMPG